MSEKSAFVPIASASAWTNGARSPDLNPQRAEGVGSRTALTWTRTLDDNLLLRPMTRDTLVECRHWSGDETGHAGTGMKRAKNLFSSILTRTRALRLLPNAFQQPLGITGHSA